MESVKKSVNPTIILAKNITLVSTKSLLLSVKKIFVA